MNAALPLRIDHEPQRIRRQIIVRGAVQGVGFRPFVYRAASALQLSGWVANSREGVTIEVEGETQALNEFVSVLQTQAPTQARIEYIGIAELPLRGESPFRIDASRSTPAELNRLPVIPADLATCPACLDELFDPDNRRYRYPFINCTQCGPRYTIVSGTPYDRARTSMRAFPMCSECAREYADPAARRFHAEPIACPHCGPTLSFSDAQGRQLADGDAAVRQAVGALQAGKIVAMKSLGGFQLLGDAGNYAAIARLREFKARPDKPFALLCHSLQQVAAICEYSALERDVLQSPQAPIVLLRRRALNDAAACIAENVAPRSQLLGVMLPFTPLHHLIANEFPTPLVATSGNIGDEPLIFTNDHAIERLGQIADGLLLHNRDIVHPCDDSLVRAMANSVVTLRRARGYAPLPLPAPASPCRILASGGHLKNTLTLLGDAAITSPHIGDLGSTPTRDRMTTTATELLDVLHGHVATIAHDLHPDYASTRLLADAPVKRVGVQHHVAHIAACIGEHSIPGPVLGVAWDGAGYGIDGTLWGGEFIVIDGAQWTRVAQLRPFRLPGGAAAMREPRRCALGVLHELFGTEVVTHQRLQALFRQQELSVLHTMLQWSINAPLTSSVGRLFDAVAALAGVRSENTFEGQAAMEFEALAEEKSAMPYPFTLRPTDSGTPLVVDWGPAIETLLHELNAGQSLAAIATAFHLGLAQAIVAVATRIGIPRVALAGGCFQNRRLLEDSVEALRAAHFTPYWPMQVPPNDGGLSYGQAIWAQRQLESNP